VVFGFGKKKLSTEMHGNLAIETSMYLCWCEDNRGGTLSPDKIKQVVIGILDRENCKYSDVDIVAISGVAITMDREQVKAFREKSGFDQQINGFEKSIGLR
jgi:hypothetical protein